MAQQECFAAIVGSGFSGVAAAIELKKEGIDDIAILERADALGGTWRDNRYPGCACDVPSHLYSFSFAPKPDWTHAFARQGEIRAYLERVADEFDVRRHVRFGRALAGARWDEAAALWRLRTASGEALSARVLVLAIGALSNPAIPRLRGAERFRGAQFHSARWDAGYDLRGKRVAVIGTGASAIQFVPAIQPEVARLTLFQRTAPWVLPIPDRAFAAWEKAALRAIPGLRRLYREWIYWSLEARVLFFVHAPALMRLVELRARRHMERSVRDPALR
ncbi:MAG TPA: NAD(P)/FAD-dependent oxidoreductase, partial [Planctomycetota bacterium]|nr:NAD(P)/FAD-dependent oxidoreductase [Planctomycetota bacterium]